MAEWQSGFVEVDGLKLHYTRTGGAKPPVVLAHGFSDDGLCWTPVARALEAVYDVVMVDARGHGRSDGPQQGYDTPQLAADLAGVIRALGLSRPPVLGHSMGAATALALAVGHPAVPGAILLEDPPAVWMPPPADAPSPEQRFAGFHTWIVELKRKTRDELIAECRARDAGWPEAELGPWADSKLRLSFNVLSRSFGAAPDWASGLGQIACPTLLITGDPGRGALVSPEAGAAFTALMPQARVAHLPGAGHNIRRDQPARYLEAVRAFLAELR